MPRGQRHLVKCKCYLPQFRGKDNPPQHQFIVFSIVDDDDAVRVKFVQCNNCAAVHKVTDICKSDILVGKDSIASIISIDDIKSSIPSNLSDILERHQSDVSVWEQAQFIYDNKKWGEFVILASEEDSGVKQGKYVRLMSETFFKIESFSREDTATYDER